jgi:hypothetical protein
MPRYLNLLATWYRASLRLYPAELRRVYGEEISDLFRQLLAAEWRCRGLRGVAGTVYDAAGEFFRIAISAHLLSDRMIATSLSLLITSGILASLIAVMMAPVLHCR